jgi:hypothetical protein
MDPTIASVSDRPWDTSVGNRLVHCSSQDHRAPLWIAVLLALVYSIGILLVRIYIKRRVFGLDDYAISTSTVGSRENTYGVTLAKSYNLRFLRLLDSL